MADGYLIVLKKANSIDLFDIYIWKTARKALEHHSLKSAESFLELHHDLKAAEYNYMAAKGIFVM